MGSGAARAVAAILGVLVIVILGACGSGGGKAGPSAAAGVSIPADFPSDDIPLVDGTLLAAGGTARDGWNLTIQAPSNAPDALEAAVRKLTDAGYQVSSRSSESGARVALLNGNKGGATYFVQVGATPNARGGANSVYYEITKK